MGFFSKAYNEIKESRAQEKKLREQYPSQPREKTYTQPSWMQRAEPFVRPEKAIKRNIQRNYNTKGSRTQRTVDTAYDNVRSFGNKKLGRASKTTTRRPDFSGRGILFR